MGLLYLNLNFLQPSGSCQDLMGLLYIYLNYLKLSGSCQT